MHLTDGNFHSSGQFVDGDPGVPSPGTQIEQAWLNMVQGEMKSILDACSVTPVKGTWTQLRDVLVNTVTAQTIAGIKTFTGRLIQTLSSALAAASFENTGAGSAIYAASMGSTDPTLNLANGGNGPVSAQVSSTTQAVAACRNNGTGPALQLQCADAHWQIQLVPTATLPSTNPAGGALSAADDGAMVYIAGAHNMLYVYSNGTGWNACW